MSTFKIIFSLVFFLLFCFPNKTLAQEKIDNFEVKVIAHQDGNMTVSESIVYDFGENSRHGIFRFIPLVSKVGDLYRVLEIEFLRIERDGKKEIFEVDNHPSQSQIKIGNPDETVTGVHSYLIEYKVKNGIGSNYEDHDEIYWNVTGNNWEVPIVSALYKIGTDFEAIPLESICFTGPKSSKFQDCEVNENFVKTTKMLEEHQGLTSVTKFPINTFPKSVLQKNEPIFDPDFLAFLKIYIPVILIVNLLAAPYLLYWYFKNKSKIRFGKPSVNFDIPKNVTPAEVGVIDTFKLERDDIVASIFSLAIKKYVKIEEVKNVKTLMPDELDYEIVKLKSFNNADKFEKILCERLFRDGDRVSLKKLTKDFYVTFGLLEDAVFYSLKVKNLYKKNPKNQMAGLLILGIISIATGNIFLGLILIFLSRKLIGRTALGDKIDWEIDGLKIFLKAVDRYHKFQSKNLIAVEKYIPFAIALGLQNEFMNQLKIINPDYNPSWYSGSRGFYYSYPSMYSTFGSSVTSSAPSSSSGFSGGSSGGGGGGGGGGSW